MICPYSFQQFCDKLKKGEKIMFNQNWYYNPNYFNPQAYAQMQAQQYEQSQQKEVLNAVKAYKDFLDAVEKLDPAHQETAARCCLFELANRMHW